MLLFLGFEESEFNKMIHVIDEFHPNTAYHLANTVVASDLVEQISLKIGLRDVLPSIIFLNTDKLDWREEISCLKNDAETKLIPVIGIGETDDLQSVLDFYTLSGGAMVNTPADQSELINVMSYTILFWKNFALLPTPHIEI